MESLSLLLLYCYYLYCWGVISGMFVLMNISCGSFVIAHDDPIVSILSLSTREKEINNGDNYHPFTTTNSIRNNIEEVEGSSMISTSIDGQRRRQQVAVD